MTSTNSVKPLKETHSTNPNYRQLEDKITPYRTDGRLLLTANF